MEAAGADRVLAGICRDQGMLELPTSIPSSEVIHPLGFCPDLAQIPIFLWGLHCTAVLHFGLRWCLGLRLGRLTYRSKQMNALI